jgi:hypothetical protein
MAQGLQHLLSKCEALGSNSSTKQTQNNNKHSNNKTQKLGIKVSAGCFLLKGESAPGLSPSPSGGW